MSCIDRLSSVCCVLLVSCGNTVVSTGGAGTGGASQHTTASGTGTGMIVTSVGTSPSMASGTVMPTSGTGPNPMDPQLCDKFCAAVGSCFGSCQTVCNSYLIAPCQSQGANLVSCLTGNFDATTCQAKAQVCDDLTQLFIECRKGTPQSCGGATGPANSTYCSETSECTGGQERATCDIQNGMAACTCYLNAMPIAECNYMDMGPDTCNLSGGCCAEFFGKASGG